MTKNAPCELTISHSHCNYLKYLCSTVSINVFMFIMQPDFTGIISYILLYSHQSLSLATQDLFCCLLTSVVLLEY